MDNRPRCHGGITFESELSSRSHGVSSEWSEKPTNSSSGKESSGNYSSRAQSEPPKRSNISSGKNVE
jgi:hypothetical protein